MPDKPVLSETPVSKRCRPVPAPNRSRRTGLNAASALSSDWVSLYHALTGATPGARPWKTTFGTSCQRTRVPIVSRRLKKCGVCSETWATLAFVIEYTVLAVNTTPLLKTCP